MKFKNILQFSILRLIKEALDELITVHFYLMFIYQKVFSIMKKWQ